MTIAICILCGLLGISITINVVFIIFLRVRYADCGNIFKIFKDDSVADKVAMKEFFDEV